MKNALRSFVSLLCLLSPAFSQTSHYDSLIAAVAANYDKIKTFTSDSLGLYKYRCS
jgi:hypothetical protein